MQIIATIIFYDDEPELFKRALNSVLGADRIICVDGAYADWPHDGIIESPQKLIDFISSFPKTEIIKSPIQPWESQVAKRNSYLVGNPGDWYINIDADEELVFADGQDFNSLRKYIRRLPLNTAWLDIQLVYRPEPDDYAAGQVPYRIFKHVPGIHYKDRHWLIFDENETPVCTEYDEQAKGNDYQGHRTKIVGIKHNKIYRNRLRLHKQGEYYRTRAHG